MQTYRITIFLLFFLFPASSYANDTKIKIGVIAPLTGGLATIGNSLKNGIELSRSKNPNKFKNIEFFYEDDQFDAKQSITAYKKLKGLNNVDLIFGLGVKLGNALAPIVEQDKVLLVNFSFEATPAVGRTYVIRTLNSTMHYMKVFADYMSSYSDTTDSYPYVKSEISFFNLMAQDFKDSLASGITAEEIGVVNPDVMDFRSHILKLKKDHKKNIGLFLLPEQIISFVRQANAMGADFTYFGTDLFESAAIITSTEKLLEGSLYPDHEVRNEFRKMYFEEFSNEAQITFAANGYEIALLFGELLGNTGSYSSDSLIQSLKEVQGRSSSMGDFSYKHDQDNGAYFDFPIEVKKIVGSKGVVVR